MEENIIELTNVHKSYGSNEVVKGIDLQVKKGEFLTLLGPSGCGKTTTLRLIAGFEELSQGTIRIDGSLWMKTRRFSASGGRISMRKPAP